MVPGLAGHLRKVRHAEHLSPVAQAAQALADDFGDAAANSGIDFVEAQNHFEAQAAKDGIVEASGQLKTIAVSLTKIGNDIRWLASGPRCGLGEISIPATQPGSSIMPGKVNPVMSEMLLMVSAQVIGNDATITFAGSGLGSTFELNVMMPALGAAILESIELLANASTIFTERCVMGIEAKRQRCNDLIEFSLAMVTGLNSKIGYDKAAVIAKESAKTGIPVRKLCMDRLSELGITEAELNEALDPARMCAPDASMVGAGGGFNRILVASGVGEVLVSLGQATALSPLVLGWLMAALIRVATGSATVAITTATGVVAPYAASVSYQNA